MKHTRILILKYEKDLYEIDDISIYKKNEWRKLAFESKLIYIYDIKTHNGMTCKNENEVNRISEYYWIHDVLIHSKLPKY